VDRWNPTIPAEALTRQSHCFDVTVKESRTRKTAERNRHRLVAKDCVTQRRTLLRVLELKVRFQLRWQSVAWIGAIRTITTAPPQQRLVPAKLNSLVMRLVEHCVTPFPVTKTNSCYNNNNNGTKV
jgi:hypothetical protein